MAQLPLHTYRTMACLLYAIIISTSTCCLLPLSLPLWNGRPEKKPDRIIVKLIASQKSGEPQNLWFSSTPIDRFITGSLRSLIWSTSSNDCWFARYSLARYFVMANGPNLVSRLHMIVKSNSGMFSALVTKHAFHTINWQLAFFWDPHHKKKQAFHQTTYDHKVFHYFTIAGVDFSILKRNISPVMAFVRKEPFNFSNKRCLWRGPAALHPAMLLQYMLKAKGLEAQSSKWTDGLTGPPDRLGDRTTKTFRCRSPRSPTSGVATGRETSDLAATCENCWSYLNVPRLFHVKICSLPLPWNLGSPTKVATSFFCSARKKERGKSSDKVTTEAPLPLLWKWAALSILSVNGFKQKIHEIMRWCFPFE